MVHCLRKYRTFEEIIYGFEDGSSFSLPDPVEITAKALTWVEQLQIRQQEFEKPLSTIASSGWPMLSKPLEGQQMSASGLFWTFGLFSGEEASRDLGVGERENYDSHRRAISGSYGPCSVSRLDHLVTQIIKLQAILCRISLWEAKRPRMPSVPGHAASTTS